MNSVSVRNIPKIGSN